MARRRRARHLFRATVFAALIALVPLVGIGPAGAGNPWVRVAAPTPSASRNLLTSVSCVGPTTCVAVGYFETQNGVRSLVMRTTDGTTWTRAVVADPSFLTLLQGVSCTAATQCTAVGSYFVGGGPGTPNFAPYMIRTTDGVHWTWVRGPDPGALDSELNGVSCVTATRCRAVGYAGLRSLVLRTSNGTTWFREPSPNRGTGANRLYSISCVNNASCTAVGDYLPHNSEDARDRTLVVRTENGPPWVAVPSPNPAPSVTGARLNGVSCVTATTCVAVGVVAPSTGSMRPFILRTTNGSTWTRSATLFPPSGVPELNSVVCTTATSCTAGGLLWTPDHDGIVANLLVRTTNGTSWTSPSPVSERPFRAVLGVSCVTEISCVGVGTFNDTGELSPSLRPLVLRET